MSGSEVFSRAKRAARRWMYGPRIDVGVETGLRSLGSAYGGWTFADLPSLRGSAIVSCGLGEDASFDVEFASVYGAEVVIVDPTPRAIAHYEAILARAGEARLCEYSSTGSQPIDAYDMAAIRADQIRLLPVALADRVGTVRFYEPADSAGVSHSIVNFQNDYSTDTPFIEVPCIDATALIAELEGRQPALLKMDIEGAEIIVLPALLEAGFHPQQILVEYDELSVPSKRSRANFESVHSKLRALGYRAVYWDHRTCVSYLRDPG